MGARENGRKFIKKDKKGFSLIEILIVIAIIALLTALVYVFLGGSTAKARDAKRLNDINQVGRFLSFGCPVTGVGAGTYDLSDLIAELKSQYPQYADKIPDDIRDPKTGTAADSKYLYIVGADNKCVLYANLEDSETAVSLSAITEATPGGGKGVFAGTAVGANNTNKYFQISN